MAFNPNAARVVSFDELKASLGHFLDTRTAAHDLHDLWTMGAPIPTEPGQPVKRVLLANQFADWWQVHVAGRHAQSGQYTMHGGKYKPVK